MISWFSQNFTRSSNSKGEQEKLYYGWVVVATLLVIGVIGFGISFSFGVFFTPLLEDFGSTRALISGIFSVYIVLGPMFAIFGGWVLDRYGAKIVVMLMGFFTGLSLLLTSQANALWHLFISYSLLLAVGVGPLYIVTMATTSRWFTKRRVLAIGIAGSGMGIGPMVMALISAWLISSYNWHTSYLVMGVMAFSIIIPCALLLKKAPVEGAALPGGEPLAASKLNTSKQQGYSRPGDLSILQAAKTRNFWLLFSTWFFLAFCVVLVLTHIVPHAIDLGITPVKAASILSLTSGLIIPGRLLIAKVSDSIGRKQASAGCALLMAGAMLLLIQPSSLLMLYLFAVIWGLSRGGFDPLVAAQIGDMFGLRNIGLIMGVLGVAWGTGAALGSGLGGYIFDISGSYIPAFLAGMVAILITAVLVLLLRTPPLKRETEGYQEAYQKETIE